jgi:hypothetical protein
MLCEDAPSDRAADGHIKWEKRRHQRGPESNWGNWGNWGKEQNDTRAKHGLSASRRT